MILHQVSVILFITMVIIQINVDPPIFYNCKSNSGRLLIFIHQILAMYIMFGAYVSNVYIHLFILIISFLAHYLNNRLCPITVIHNKWCGYDTDVKLNTFINYIVPENFVVTTYYSILFVAFLYDISKILL